ncbi:MAG: GHKL domain-containing protein [Bacteroidales bacterium]|jgi:hypothetical protein|nr:GHKL domain-containing protein [Bacteroidales bacterium]
METYFASAERSIIETILKQHDHINNIGPSQQIIDAMPCLGAIINSNRQIIYANGALMSLLGLENMEQALGLRPGELVYCINAHKMPGGCGTAKECRYCGAVNSIVKCQETGEPYVGECCITSVINSNRISFEFQIACTPFYLSNEDRYTIITLTDISSKKRKEILENTFLHDLTNKTTNLQGLSVLIKRADKQGQLGKLTDILGMVSNSINDEIVSYRQLLNAESNTLSMNVEKVRAYDMIYNATQLVKFNINLQNKEILMKPPFPDVSLRTDTALLQRSLLNMLKNALEATPDNIPVHIGYDVNEDSVTFWVKNATAMPEHVKSRVFQRSFSTKGTDRGIGTYSMKLLVEQYLGGKVDFESDEQNGTRFFVMLPLKSMMEE